MSFRFTLGLLVLAVIVIGGLTIAQSRMPSNAGPTVTPTPVLVNLQTTDITGLDIRSSSHETALIKNGANWQLVKPVKDANVDQSKVDSLVGQLAPLNASRSVGSSNQDLSPFGLKTPSLTVSLATSGKKTTTVLIGGKNVNGDSYYAMLKGGGEVDLISNSVVNGLNGILITPPRATPTPTPAPRRPASPVASAVSTPSPSGAPSASA